MIDVQRQRLFTRAVYGFEKQCLMKSGGVLNAKQSICDLRFFANIVLDGEQSNTDVVIMAGDGMRHGGKWTSYAQLWTDSTWTMMLARHHRTLLVLLHELAHVLTPKARYDHGPAFGRKYMHLLNAYAGLRREDMVAVMPPAVQEIMV